MRSSPRDYPRQPWAFAWLIGALIPLFSVVAGAAADIPEGYQPYQPGARAVQESLSFVILAYVLIWVGLVVFLGSVWLRQRTIAAELERLAVKAASDTDDI